MFKKIIVLSVLGFFVSCNHIPEENRTLNVSQHDEVAVFSIPKAACKKCQTVIEDGLKNQNGVKQTILNLHTKEVSIVYQPEVISESVIKEKVTKLEGEIPCK
ncbi:MAG: cation transporter [Winogradskyella sp.]|uniref:cation transporter n=1 Tax=Winogradskyella sp. TaxID=1883156 RepID=UPI0025DF8020|nr:cation transporter [Winogradskyella sp.]NRB82265.1 cation transporter [Winogradskyella sp.]